MGGALLLSDKINPLADKQHGQRANKSRQLFHRYFRPANQIRDISC